MDHRKRLSTIIRNVLIKYTSTALTENVLVLFQIGKAFAPPTEKLCDFFYKTVMMLNLHTKDGQKVCNLQAL